MWDNSRSNHSAPGTGETYLPKTRFFIFRYARRIAGQLNSHQDRIRGENDSVDLIPIQRISSPRREYERMLYRPAKFS